MRTQPVHHRHLLAAAICLCLAPAAFAAQPEVNAEREAITVGTEAAAYTLRLSYPDGRSSERVMLAGESFAIDAASPGGLLADGVYQFEAHPITGLRERADGDAVPQATKTAHAPMAAESGSFQVYQGRIVVADSEAPKQGDQDFGVRMKDQVIPDDLIVQSSACVGQDCVNGENFGFDTLRLKENNLRLHFDDTSSSGSFPSNDWTLIANDSSNGGANYFAIEDRTAGRHVFEVRAGAPANSLFVDASGRIGIKTSTPVVNLHVAEGNTPAIRLEQNGSSGFTAQTWDVAGNEANFFVRDVTNGSRLPFKIKPGAPTDSLYVAANGDIALGSATPSAHLDVVGAASGTRPVARIRGGTAATAPGWGGDDVAVFENDAALNSFIHLFAADNRSMAIGFSNSGSRLDGAITYVNATDTMFFRSGSGPTAMRIPASGIVSFPQGIGTTTVQGDLTVTGTLTPDYVFEDGFKTLSIDEHADFMWRYKHLPMVDAAETNSQGKGLVNVGLRAQQLLEELEYAHIYIHQLHQRLGEMEQQQASLEARLSDIEAHR